MVFFPGPIIFGIVDTLCSWFLTYKWRNPRFEALIAAKRDELRSSFPLAYVDEDNAAHRPAA